MYLIHIYIPYSNRVQNPPPRGDFWTPSFLTEKMESNSFDTLHFRRSFGLLLFVRPPSPKNAQNSLKNRSVGQALSVLSDKFPVWYHLTFLVFLLPFTLLGASLGARRSN